MTLYDSSDLVDDLGERLAVADSEFEDDGLTDVLEADVL